MTRMGTEDRESAEQIRALNLRVVAALIFQVAAQVKEIVGVLADHRALAIHFVGPSTGAVKPRPPSAI